MDDLTNSKNPIKLVPFLIFTALLAITPATAAGSHADEYQPIPNQPAGTLQPVGTTEYRLLIDVLKAPPHDHDDIQRRQRRRRLAPYQLCLLCKCCSATTCTSMPCCFGIDCQLPNKPFGVCAFVPRTCNCTNCTTSV
ncbi:uncharacterized protein LOC110769355 [Prunus avium]|uniref:Uncharacterized protein LOC110769355 n=1 Tax=Prunus avium TaxID=42229 RepID=A0A6P5TPM2_PRUAV|nr:uncharacterized protein LOC110769355 [Prunus avium]